MEKIALGVTTAEVTYGLCPRMFRKSARSLSYDKLVVVVAIDEVPNQKRQGGHDGVVILPSRLD